MRLRAPLDLDRDGAGWPHREASGLVDAAGLRWHVQVMGQGPDVLLIHGTGAATHSWRAVLPLLAARHRVIAADLPGHGFSAPLTQRPTLAAMAAAHAALLRRLEVAPQQIVGHSAGAAIATAMVLDCSVRARRIISINGALLPFAGWAALLFAPMARALALTPLAAAVFARRARDPRAVARLVHSTGSRLSDESMALYGRLLATPAHVDGALAMMAAWDLAPLSARLPQLPLRGCALRLVVGERDRTVDPAEAAQVAARVPGAEVVRCAGLGHLAHEEAPQQLATLITDGQTAAAALQ